MVTFPKEMTKDEKINSLEGIVDYMEEFMNLNGLIDDFGTFLEVRQSKEFRESQLN